MSKPDRWRRGARQDAGTGEAAVEFQQRPSQLRKSIDIVYVLPKIQLQTLCHLNKPLVNYEVEQHSL